MTDTAERAGNSVLGCLLAYYKPELVVVVQAKGVGPSDFPREQQRAVWRAILALHKTGSHVDVLTVMAFLERHGWLERVGGEPFLVACVESAVPSALKDHAWLVAEEKRWERLLQACDSVERACRSRDDDALREASSLLRRDVLAPGERPKLTVVDGEKAA
jgi:replicative DNA helicase